MPIDSKVALQNAANYLAQFYPDVHSIQLEEIEITEDKKFWILTLSYLGRDNTGYISMLSKQLKTFRIDRETGEVLSMKIREIK